MYRRLDPERTIETIARLHRRISERFPNAGLVHVCGELLDIAEENRQRCEWISKPNRWIRLGVAVVVLAGAAGLVYSVSLLDIRWTRFDFGELVQMTEAGLNELALIGAALFFLVTVEARVKRARALDALHELRSIAHVIDMHQLTKDPGQSRAGVSFTAASPKRDLSPYELTRYLDYCSEMLSLTGKVAALYVHGFRDQVVLSAVNELEVLTTGLSRKIWQKIMILSKLDDADPAMSHATRLYGAD